MTRGYVILIAFAFLASAFAEDLYPDKYDYVDVDSVLANDRQREQYSNCFMDLGPCVTSDAKFFKQYLPEAISTQCKKCTEKQKEIFNKVADWYNAHDKAAWDNFVEKMLETMKSTNEGKE